MSIVTVINLDTCEERTYTLTPQEAVNAAFEYDRGNLNTWTYAETLDKVQVSKDGKTCIRGHWCGVMKEEK